MHRCISQWIAIAVVALPAMMRAETVGLFFDDKEPQVKFAAGDVKAALEEREITVETLPLESLKDAYANRKIVIGTASTPSIGTALAAQGESPKSALGPQAYQLITTAKPQKSYWVLGGDTAGAMYGGLQLAEKISFDGLAASYDEEVAPDFLQRGVKLNLPMDKRLPTYSGYMPAMPFKMSGI
jgi:hypothetical protein